MDSDALLAAIAQQPVSVAIEADQKAFQFYQSGIITENCGTNLDHGVLAVGFGVDNGTQFIKIKNSWDTTWGEDGYVRIAVTDGAGMCGVNSQPSFPATN
jgi:C1A family cysteine protease